MGETTQKTAENGTLGHLMFGRNEPALHHFFSLTKGLHCLWGSALTILLSVSNTQCDRTWLSSRPSMKFKAWLERYPISCCARLGSVAAIAGGTAVNWFSSCVNRSTTNE